MSYLVSDFLINPVLRQARRFSRSNTPAELPESSEPNVRSRAQEIIVDEHPVEAAEQSRHDCLPTDGGTFGVPLTAPPVQEDERSGAELESDGVSIHEVNSTNTTPAALSSAHSDDETSDNPLYTPNPFRGSASPSTLNLETMSPAEGPSRPQSTETSHNRSASLPADDGMGALRQGIILIQALDIPAAEKAQKMHQLLTRDYSRSQSFHARQQPQTSLPLDAMISQERPEASATLSSFLWQINGAEEEETPEEHHTFHLAPSDLERTYAPPDLPENEDGSSGDGEEGEEERSQITVLGCKHYKRNVKLQCSTCSKWYTCRLCHDEVEEHTLIRKDTKNMLCMMCGCAQRAGEFCVGCGERTSWYYCSVCKLWDNDPNKSIYHCHDCGICRKGRGIGKDFFHCKTCGVCMSMSVETSHKCIERVSDCDCPICGEYMFSSPRPVVFMLCGHSIHHTCYYEHMKSSYKCPICSKSTVNMETQFRNLDRAIDSQPMPPQFQDTKAMVSCNDCYAKSAVKYHWLGLKCAICDSYNTAQLSILSDPAVEVPVIEPRESEADLLPDRSEPDGPAAMPGRQRGRRHSSHAYPVSQDINLFSPVTLPARLGRSLSPVRSSFLDTPQARTTTAASDESGDDDDLDFWGREEHRSVTSAENIELGLAEEDEYDDNSDDSTSAVDECDENDEIEEEDKFAVFGHR